MTSDTLGAQSFHSRRKTPATLESGARARDSRIGGRSVDAVSADEKAVVR